MTRWLLRVVAAAATAYATAMGIAHLHGEDAQSATFVQTVALGAIDKTLTIPAEAARPRFSVLYFGDSLAMVEAPVRNSNRAVTYLLRQELENTMVAAGAGQPGDLRLIPITHSGLSVWSLYYMADRIAALRPDFVVLEFNLYNFSRFWQKRDRKILGALLPLKRLPEMLTLPTGDTGLAMDEWGFSKLVLATGTLPWWERVQREQERATNAYWSWSDRLQQWTGKEKLEFRLLNYMEAMAKTQDPVTKRSTLEYSRKLFGPSLSGIDTGNSTFRMFSTALARLESAGIPVLIYVPPYNLDHLGQLGLLEGSRLAESIQLAREVSEQHGALFVDAHALFDDTHFRDAMDHLNENEAVDGHKALALHLAQAMADEWRRVVTAGR
jgi:hypothetical protein